MSFYNPMDWYWIVGGDQTKVYSSARGIYVPVADATYVGWLARGNSPTVIDTSANLGAALSAYGRPADAGVLDGFVSDQAATITKSPLFKVLFNHENRIRALEGKVALTPAQALAAVKALM